MDDIDTILGAIGAVGILYYVAKFIIDAAESTMYDPKTVKKLSKLEKELGSELERLEDFSMKPTRKYRILDMTLKRIRD